MEIFGLIVLIIVGLSLALVGVANLVAAFDTNKNDAESTRHIVTAMVTLVAATFAFHFAGDWWFSHYDIVRIK